MKLKFTFFLLVAICAWISLTSDASGRGSNTTGCGTGTGCHNTTPATGATIIDSVSLVDKTTGLSASQYVAGRAYRLRLTGRFLGTANLPKFGFQIGHGGKGSFSGTPSSTTVTGNFWGHTSPKDSYLRVTTPTTMILYTDTCTWTAPATGSGTVTFSGQLNAVNSGGTAASDRPTGFTYTRNIPEFLANVTITKSGFPATICPGVSNTFTATPVNGGSTPTYQWKVNNANVGTGGTTYTAILNPGDSITCVMTSSISGIGNSPATSNKLYVAAGFVNKDTITAPTTTVCAGDTVTFTSTPATGSTNPQYRWYVNQTQVYGPGMTPPNNVNSATYRKIGFNVGDSISCRLTVVNTCAFPTIDTSNYIKMNVSPSPVVSGFSNQAICSGDSSVATNWTSSLSGTTYSWTNTNTAIGLPASGTGQIGKFLSDNPGTTPINATITINSFASGCNGLPRTYTITVVPKPKVRRPNLNPYCHGATVNINLQSIPATGTTINWTNDNPSIGLAASGSGSNISFSATNTSADSLVANISAHATAGACVGLDSTFRVVVYRTPIVNKPNDVTVCAGDPIPASSFSANPSGTLFSWTNSNASIGLGASGTGDYAATTGSTAGIATITVNGNYKGCNSTPVTYKINVNSLSPPTVTITASDTLICAGGTVIFKSTNTNGGSTPTYKWTKNNVPIGGTVDTLELSNVNPGDSVQCEIISNSACASPKIASSNTIRLGTLPNAIPTIGLSSIRDTVCEGIPMTINASIANGGGSPTYKWYLNGVLKSGVTGNSFLATNWADKDTIYCELTSSLACADPKVVKSNVKKIRVFPIYNVSIDMDKDKSKICSDDLVTFTLAAKGGSKDPKVVWKLNSQEVSTNPSFVTLPIFSQYDMVTVEYHSGYVCQDPPNVLVKSLSVDSVKHGPIADYLPHNYISFCDGDSTMVKVYNGQPQYIYKWSNGFDGDSFVAKESESYLVTVTEPNNACKRIYGPMTTYKEPLPMKPYVEKIDRDSNIMQAALADNYQWQVNKQDIYSAADRRYAFILPGMYRLKTVNFAGCVSYSDEIDPFKFGVGISSKIKSADFNIYPNPSTGKFYIESSKSTIKHISVYNLLGEMVFESKVNHKTKEVDIQNRSKGIYILRLDIGQETFYQRIEIK